MSNDPITLFVDYIKQQKLDALLAFYASQNDDANTAQLKFCYQQAMQSNDAFSFFQDLVGKLVVSKGAIPTGVIAGINSLQRLSFFSPAITDTQSYTLTNSQGNTVLHALLSQKSLTELPFNYLRSLLLFERNESLAHALGVKNNFKMRPVDCYLAFNQAFESLPDHEFSALLALCEVQTKTGDGSEPGMLNAICRHLIKSQQVQYLHSEHQRVILIASAFSQSTGNICKQLKI